MDAIRPRLPRHRCDSLGSIPAGTTRAYLVTRILFDEVRQHCARIGIEEGTRLSCQDRRDGLVYVRLPGSRSCCIEVEHASFVEVEPDLSAQAVA